MPYVAISNSDIQVGDPIKQSLMQTIKDDLDYFNGTLGTFGSIDVLNGSMEIDADADTIPDGWTRSLYTGGSGSRVTNTTFGHGAYAMRFTQPAGASQGGGDLLSDYIPIHAAATGEPLYLRFHCGRSNSAMVAKIKILSFTYAKAANGADVTIYDSSTEASDTSFGVWRIAAFRPNLNSGFIRIRLIGGEVGPTLGSPATTDFDGISLIPNVPIANVRSNTQAEVNTAVTSYTNIATLSFQFPCKIYNCPVLLQIPGELRSDTATHGGYIRMDVGANQSNEVYHYGAWPQSNCWYIKVPAGAAGSGIGTLSISVLGKADTSSIVYWKKLVGTIIGTILDPLS